MFDVREEGDPRNLVVRRILRPAWIVGFIATIVAKHERAALMRDGEVEYKGAEHVLAARRVLVRLEERPWTFTVY